MSSSSVFFVIPFVQASLKLILLSPAQAGGFLGGVFLWSITLRKRSGKTRVVAGKSER